ncbi:MAG: hypothetical protein ACOYYS_06215, partial [Chloroflexota bacterium]
MHSRQTTYDLAGQRINTVDAMNIVTHFEYDALGRLTAVVENYLPGVNPTSEINVRTEYTYDVAGNRRTIKDALLHVTNFGYDAFGRMTREVDALSHTTYYTYTASGQQAQKTDANGFTTSYTYDRLGHLLLTDYPVPDVDVRSQYNILGQQTVMTDSVGVTSWVYDGLGRALTITDPFTGTVQYRYDAAGNRTSLIYPDLKTVTYTYDDAGRLETVRDWDNLVTTYTYDRAGRLSTESLPNGVTKTYTYDDAGHLLSLVHARGSETLSSFAYTYDANGNRLTASENTLRPVEGQDLLFADGFEGGDFMLWGGGNLLNGKLSVTTTAAISGTYGMQADITSNTPIYAIDPTPNAETRYRTRFYFDISGLSMGDNKQFKVFQVFNASSNELAAIEIRKSAGDYQVRAAVSTDTGSWSYTSWVTIASGIHALELDWRAASGMNANNGGITFWVDGTEQGNYTNVDNDTRTVDKVWLGALGNIDVFTRGTLSFDLFESRQQNYIGLVPGVQMQPLPVKTDTLFGDGFESGNFTAWSASVADSGDLSVSSAAAISGTNGLQALLDDNFSIYLTDWKPFEETTYRARFYFDPNSIQMVHGDVHYIFVAYNRDSLAVARVELRFSAGDYQVRSEAVNNTTTWSSTPWVTIADGPHALELNWQAATSSGANNGVLTFWVDGVQQGVFTNLVNETRKIDYVHLGAVSGIDPGTRGIYFFDLFESRRTSYIGLVPGAPIQPMPAKTDALFADSFESGDLSAWSTSVIDGGDLAASAAAAIGGNNGLQAVLDDNVLIYATDWRPYEETRYRVRFYFDPNGIVMANNDA